MGKAELQVIVKAKDLSKYIMTVTQKSPKQYRFTFTSRLQNLALQIITDIYYANDIYVGSMKETNARERAQRRLDKQHDAITNARLLAYIAQTSLELRVITPKQYEIISKEVSEVIYMLSGWIKSDEKRVGKIL